MDQLVADQNGFTEIWNGLDLDWSLQGLPTIDEKNLKYGIKGLFFNKGEQELEPTVTIPIMPKYDNTTDAKFQVFASNYLGDSLGEAFLKAQPIHYWTLSKDVPDYVPITLTTSGLNFFFPGLESHYGKDLPIDIEYSVERIGNFSA